MDRDMYQMRYHEALTKAFSANAANVREAYFDLANFYYEKLDGQVNSFPSHEVLQQCLATRRRAC